MRGKEGKIVVVLVGDDARKQVWLLRELSKEDRLEREG